MNIKDIKGSYDLEAYEKLCEEREAMQRKFRGKIMRLSKKGDRMGKKYIAILRNKILEHFNVTSRFPKELEPIDPEKSRETLIECYIGDRGKISMHNRIFISAYDPSITYMIRNENNISQVIKGEFDESDDIEMAFEKILSEVKRFNNTFKNNIQWTK